MSEQLDGFAVMRRNGEIYTVAVDTEDYERVLAAGPWFVVFTGPKKAGPYAQRNVRSEGGGWTSQLLHGFILDLHAVAHPDGIDHKNGRQLDNRLSNLRAATQAQNLQNQRLRLSSRSGVSGVCWDKQRQKWLARITANDRHIHLGRFIEKSDAVAARVTAEARYHPGKVVNRASDRALIPVIAF